MADRFHLLKYGLSFVLSFIGVKMLLPLVAEGTLMIIGEHSTGGFAGFLKDYKSGVYSQEVINISLGVVSGTIALSVILSLIFPPKASTARIKGLNHALRAGRCFDPDNDEE